MSDFILITTDLAIFNPIFGQATVTVRPGLITGSGKAMISKKTICIDGDEKTVIVPGCSYITPSFNVPPGLGTLLIESLATDQKAKRVKSNHKFVLLKGSTFKAKFLVTLPAAGSDPTPYYMGSGTFVTTNVRVRAT